MSKWELQLPANKLDFVVSLPDIYEFMVVAIVRELWQRIYSTNENDSLTSLHTKQILLEG